MDSQNISFINVTGKPTKDERDQARKQSTAARREEKKERLRQEERAETLAGLESQENEKKQTYALLARLTCPSTLPDPPRIHRFSASREDPFIKYPFELSYSERKLLDHSKLPLRLSFYEYY